MLQLEQATLTGIDILRVCPEARPLRVRRADDQGGLSRIYDPHFTTAEGCASAMARVNPHICSAYRVDMGQRFVWHGVAQSFHPIPIFVFSRMEHKCFTHRTSFRIDTDSQMNAPTITPELLRRYDMPGPRYTSYPTADRFVEAFGENDFRQALAQRRVGAKAPLPLSLYIHVPFCESICYYCACNKVVTKHHERARPYLQTLAREIGLVADELQVRQRVSQLHFGGGTPTFMSDDELGEVMALVRSRFDLVPGGEYSIEIDPRTVTPARLKRLAELGFNRLSFGVQDFDADVQRAVHRVQSAESIFELVAEARALGFESINVDLIYGLPRQTTSSFAHTMAQVAALRPDRIALYGYAHLPQRFKPQRRIATDELPTAAVRLALLSDAIKELRTAGYDYIGMDHFALPQDALAVAKRQGRLYRNFQGYSTYPECDLIGLGVSAISRVGATYSQNAKELDDYTDMVDHGRLPVVRGLALSRDDLVRRAVISAIMCQGEVSFESIDLSYLIEFRRYFAAELDILDMARREKLVDIDSAGIHVTPLGWYFVRAVAMPFDRYLRADQTRERFSRII